MPHLIDYVENDGTLAHYNMLQVIRDFAADNGWQVLRYNTEAANRELILKGAGYTGEEEIFVGFRTYQNASADYYNLCAAVFTGYVAGNPFDNQPGIKLSGVPAHNNRIDYWLTLNPQRIAMALKVGTPVYEHCYVGKFFAYGRPGQYPYPVACAGMLNGAAAIRFSDTSTNHVMGYKGNRASLGVRTNDSWIAPYIYPWSNVYLTGTGASNTNTNLRDTEGIYHLLPLELHSSDSNVWGALDGVCYISGFNNAVENTLVVDEFDYVVMQDTSRTGHTDYYALRLDQ